tara:strand:+ start:147 stop:416 length:270 start_codon:yes stop_codon:yes gene_type:complete
MNCPMCAGITQTVLTRPVSDKYGNLINNHEVVRRKKCLICNHRFYTHGKKKKGRFDKSPENLLQNSQVVYIGFKNQKVTILNESNKLKR